MRFLLSVFILFFSVSPALADAVMDQVNKSGTLRCGYVVYSPGTTHTGEKGALEGFNVDLMEEITRRMGLKLEWHESNWPTLSTDLNTNKFDAACVSYWSNPRAARQMLSTIPLWYQPVFFITRVEDNRFDNKISLINDESVSVSILEGDVPETILNELYPKAKQVALPQNASFPQVFQEVASKRADVTIAAKPDVAKFQEHNPGVLKILYKRPVRLYASAMQLKPGSTQLKNALDVTIREMQLDGTIKKIVSKYVGSRDDYYFIGYPFSKAELPE